MILAFLNRRQHVGRIGWLAGRVIVAHLVEIVLEISVLKLLLMQRLRVAQVRVLLRIYSCVLRFAFIVSELLTGIEFAAEVGVL